MVLTPARRNHYFFGKILNVGDLEMEQDYGKQKRWLINRLTLGSGVVDGLSVGVSDGRLTITDGVAFDGLGREIVIPSTVTVDPVRRWTIEVSSSASSDREPGSLKSRVTCQGGSRARSRWTDST